MQGATNDNGYPLHKQLTSSFMVSILMDYMMAKHYLSTEYSDVDNELDHDNYTTASTPNKYNVLTELTYYNEQKLYSLTTYVVSKQTEDKIVSVSRLRQLIEKNNLPLYEICGEVFLMMIDATLYGNEINESGKLMMTNYRLLFFNIVSKLIDLPFGFLSHIETLPKKPMVILHLKYPHQWRLQLTNLKDMQQLSQWVSLYHHSYNITLSFAYTYALKTHYAAYRFNIEEEYERINISKGDKYYRCDNSNFGLCETYPSVFYVKQTMRRSLEKDNLLETVALHRRNRRLPVLSYVFQNVVQKVLAELWVASDYDETKKITVSVEQEYLRSLANGEGELTVYVCGAKQAKVIDEGNYYPPSKMVFLNLSSLYYLRRAERNMMYIYLFRRDDFLQYVLKSKWYHQVGYLLRAASAIATTLLMGVPVLLRGGYGWDRVLQLVCLVQIIIDPIARTFKGFYRMIMMQFVNFGHPFARRLGYTANKYYRYPVFLQFLDCVSQLITQNIFHFYYNYKYLSRLANLMLTNIYGTFIAYTPKQYHNADVYIHTVSIWKDLISQLTLSGYYEQKCGTLSVKPDIDELRLWKEYFNNLVTKSKDHYGLSLIAEDNSDYVNLYCLRIKRKNYKLYNEVKLQNEQIKILKYSIQLIEKRKT